MFINFLYFLFISLSCVGYGAFIQNKTNIKSKEFNNLGAFGITGIFLLNIITYSLSFVDKINPLLNLLLLVIGIFFFFFYFYKISLKKTYLYIIIFILIYVGLLIGKPHDDFHYYHFPYIHYLLNSDFIYGIGHLNHGFRTSSSIFYINAFFFNPSIGYGTFHFGAALYMLFANVYLYEKITFFNKEKKRNISIFAICIFIFINIFFYRIGEHGTDRSAQILSLIFLFEIFIFINLKNNTENRIKILIILLGLIVSLKAFYILFLVFSFIILNHLYLKEKKNIKKILYTVFFNLIFILFFINILYVIIVSLINTGCLLYPVSFTCLDDLSWSVGSIEAIKMNNWYELWSKGGATPNMRVLNQEEYLTSFNWVSNWINIYFFNKVSDFLLGIIFLCLIIFFTFRFKLGFSNYKFKLILFFILILIIEWFYNHPALRYGGYSLISGMFFLILSSLNFKKPITNFTFQRNIKYFIAISLSVFLLRNIDRIIQEYDKYKYNPIQNPNYNFNTHDFRVINKIELLKSDINCKEKKKCKDNVYRINFLTNKKYFISRKDND